MFDCKLVVSGFRTFYSSVTEHIMTFLHKLQLIIPNINMCVNRPTVSCSLCDCAEDEVVSLVRRLTVVGLITPY